MSKFQSHFEPKDVLYANFFDEASKRQLIPTLQRTYTWEKKEIEKLWEDIDDNQSPYFIGTVVMIKAEGSTGRDEVIDGQQRLTTIHLILIALRNYIGNKDGFEDIKYEIETLLLEPRLNKEPLRRLVFSNPQSDSIYEKFVYDKQRSNIETDLEKKFEENYNIALDLITKHSPNCDIDKITEIYNKFKYLELVFIGCSDKSAAYKLFASLNATAVSLASIDLIKNSLLMMLSLDAESLDVAEKKWMMIEETFSKDMQLFKKFIRHHWISRGQYSNESTLYSNFEAKFIADNKIDEVIVYLDDLVLASELYLNFRYANVDDISGLTGARFDKREVKDTLEFLSFLNVDQVYSVLLFVFKNNPKDFKKHLIKLSAFQFLFKHVPGSPSKVESIFASYCEGKIKTDKLYSDLLVICSGQKVAFSESVSEKLKYKSGRSGDVQFILEKYLYSKGPGESFSKPTIEHIIAQKPEKKEMDVLLPQFGNDKKIFNAYKHKLGNLTILEKSSNSSVDFSNKSFSEKKELYNQTNFTVNTEVLNYKFENHPMKAIDERTEDLAEGIFDIFIDALKTGKWPNSKNED